MSTQAQEDRPFVGLCERCGRNELLFPLMERYFDPAPERRRYVTRVKSHVCMRCIRELRVAHTTKQEATS